MTFRTLYAVIFDLGGTLTRLVEDEEILIREGARLALEYLLEVGMTLPRDEFVDKYVEALHFAARKSALEQEEHLASDTLVFLLQFYGYPNPEQVIIQEAVRRTFLPWVQAHVLDDDAIPTLRALRRRGLRLGILTNAQDEAAVREVTARLGLDEHVDAIVVSAGLPERPRKPNVAAWDPFWEEWDLLPYEAVMVGDDLVEDILGALNATMWTVWLRRHPAGSELERAIRPDTTITRLAEVLDVLEKWEHEGESAGEEGHREDERG